MDDRRRHSLAREDRRDDRQRAGAAQRWPPSTGRRRATRARSPITTRSTPTPRSASPSSATSAATTGCSAPACRCRRSNAGWSARTAITRACARWSSMAGARDRSSERLGLRLTAGTLGDGARSARSAMTKRVPRATVGSSRSVPPARSIARFAIARPRPLPSTSPRLRAAVEAFEDRVTVFGRDPGPVVGDRDLDRRFGGGVAS